MTSRVGSYSSYYECEKQFNQLPLWKKIAAVAFVAFSTLISFGTLFETSFLYIIERLSVKEESGKVTKPKINDLTQKRPSLSAEEKQQLEKQYDEWFSSQKNILCPSRTINEKALWLASLYVTDNKKSDNEKWALIDILKERFKKEQERQTKKNTPPVPFPTQPVKTNSKKFTIKTERLNSEGKKVIVEKEYKRWDTVGGGDCAFHALFGELKNKTFTADLAVRKEFCDHLKANPLPPSFINQLEEFFEYLHKEEEDSDEVKNNGRLVAEYLEALSPVFEKGFKENKGYKADISAIKKALKDVEGSQEPTAIDERKRLNGQLDAVKKRFVEDPDVKNVSLNKLGTKGVFLFQHELIELAKFKNKPLIIHQKDHKGNEISTKYLNGDIVPNNTIYVKKDEKKESKWTHIYFSLAHFERVTKVTQDIIFK